jgi:hypothetical protein
MSDKIDQAISDRLKDILAEGISDDAMKHVKKACEDVVSQVEDDLMWRIKDDLAPNLTAWCADMAQRAVEQMLEGNDDQMRRYLSCEKRGEDGKYIGWTGRSDSDVWGRKREDHEQHPVIHGSLFEQGAMALRKKVVDAHREMLVSERILDLEDQVKSLVAQVNKAKAEKEAMWERVRGVA